MRNQADGLIHATRKTLEEAGEQATADEKAAIETAITELETAMKADSKDNIDAKTKALTEVSSGLAQRMSAEQAKAASGAGAGAGAAAGTDPDAVDAEFEEVKDERK